MGRSAWLLVVLALGCTDAPKADPTPRDAGVAPTGDRDGGSVVVEPAARALLIDLDLVSEEGWIDLFAALESENIALDYRRTYPRITTEDQRYDLVFIALGRAPDPAGAMLSDADERAAVALVEAGNIVVLLPAVTYPDSVTGLNDWFYGNRILERLDAPIRIERGLLIGTAFVGPGGGPVQDRERGYATTLERQFGYAWLQRARAAGAGEMIAGGHTTILATDELRAETYLYAEAGVLHQTQLGGANVFPLTSRRAVAAAAPVSNGVVGVLPRSVVTLGSATDRLSTQPATSTDRLLDHQPLLRNIVRRLFSLREGHPAAPADVLASQPLFTVRAVGVPPLGTNESVMIPIQPRVRPDIEAPPQGVVATDRIATLTDSPTLAFTADPKPVIAFGDIPATSAEARTMFDRAKELGFSAFVGLEVPERLVGLEGEALERRRARIRDVADEAEASSMPWFVGMYYMGEAYNVEPSRWTTSLGAQGQTLAAPPIAYDRIWDEVLIPAIDEVARIAEEHPGIAGIEMDFELYGTTPWYAEAQAFDDSTYRIFLASVAAGPTKDRLVGAARETRLDLLVDLGLLDDYFDALEAWAYALGVRVRETATAHRSDFDFAMYTPPYPSAWLYRGLARGLGTPAHPVMLLSYQARGHAARSVTSARGISAVHLGGFIGANFAPDAAVLALNSLRTHNDGAWFFSFSDLLANPSLAEKIGEAIAAD